MLDMRIIKHNPPATGMTPLRDWCLRLGCLLWIVSATGCFERTYHDRMQVTVKFYEHLDVLNRNLGVEWMEGGFKLRPPKGFDFIPKPVPPPPDPNDPQAKPVDEESLEDLRQPGYLGIKLPGMTAAWQKNVAVDEPGGTTTRKAYIYLLGNIKLFSVPSDRPGRIDPTKFQEYGVNLLATELGVQFKAEEWKPEEFPPPPFKLVPIVKGDRLLLLPERMFEETKMTFRIFIKSEKDTQAIVLFVYPDSTSSSEKLTERINLALETLRVPAEASAASVPAPGTVGPAGVPAL